MKKINYNSISLDLLLKVRLLILCIFLMMNFLLSEPAQNFGIMYISKPPGYQISSTDGLTISLSDSGEINRIEINDTVLPMLIAQGGFSFREVLSSESFFGPTIYLKGNIRKNSDRTITQKVQANDIDFNFTYISRDKFIEIRGEIQDLKKLDRSLQLNYNLPVNANGWKWGDYIRADRKIGEGTRYENVYVIAPWSDRDKKPNRMQSVYPFSSIDNGSNGLSFAVPMDVPRIYRISYDLSTGYSIQYDFGLSQHTEKIGKGRTNFTFIIYKIDEPEWGFRSVVKKYYEVYPQFFVKRNSMEGNLIWIHEREPYTSANLNDFGITFDISQEFAYNSSNSRMLSNFVKGIFSFQYIEPWGIWRAFPDFAKEPIYIEKIEALKSDLDKPDSQNSEGSGILGSKKQAQSIFNCAPLNIFGEMYLEIEGLWNQGSWGAPMQNYPINPDPDLPSPNGYDLTYIKYQMASGKGLELGGISVDSVGATFFWHPIDNYRTQNSSYSDLPEDYLIDHYKYADIPLVFSYTSGKPVMLELFSNYEYFVKMRSNIISDKRLIHANIFPDSYNFFAHFIDILGGETGAAEPYTKDGWDSNDTTSSYRRTLSYQKTNINIYTAGWTWKAQRSDTENYIKQSTFYAIFPGSSSGGFYVDSNRDLFKKYIPIIKNISKAGWEPIPYAVINNKNIMIERYGYWSGNNLYYTVRNNDAIEQSATMVIDLSRMGAKELVSIEVDELTSKTLFNPRINNKKVTIDFPIKPHDTLVFKIGRI